MKSTQRLEYGQLAKVMAERGMVEPQALQEALDASTKGGVPFPTALVNANLVPDWELSRVVCELYNLPFLTVDMCTPDPDAVSAVSEETIRETGIIPLNRYGEVLTLCMPGLVNAETLGMLAAELDVFILPVVGTVRSNWLWIESNMTPKQVVNQEPSLSPEVSADWSDIFDAADAAVLLDLEEDLKNEGSEGSAEEDDDETSMPELGPALEFKPKDGEEDAA